MLLDDADAARKRYKKDLDFIKPDLAAYNKQKEIALGLAPGTLSKAGGSSSSAITAFDPHAGSSVSHYPGRAAVALTPCTQVTPTSVQQRLAAESLYRDANSLLYADNKPSEEAIDRVVGKINAEYVFVSDYTLACAQTCAVSTRKRSSRESGPTKTKATSPTSTSGIVCSTRRYACFAHSSRMRFAHCMLCVL